MREVSWRSSAIAPVLVNPKVYTFIAEGYPAFSQIGEVSSDMVYINRRYSWRKHDAVILGDYILDTFTSAIGAIYINVYDMNGAYLRSVTVVSSSLYLIDGVYYGICKPSNSSSAYLFFLDSSRQLRRATITPGSGGSLSISITNLGVYDPWANYTGYLDPANQIASIHIAPVDHNVCFIMIRFTPTSTWVMRSFILAYDSGALVPIAFSDIDYTIIDAEKNANGVYVVIASSTFAFTSSIMMYRERVSYPDVEPFLDHIDNELVGVIVSSISVNQATNNLSDLLGTAIFCHKNMDGNVSLIYTALLRSLDGGRSWGIIPYGKIRDDGIWLKPLVTSNYTYLVGASGMLRALTIPSLKPSYTLTSSPNTYDISDQVLSLRMMMDVGRSTEGQTDVNIQGIPISIRSGDEVIRGYSVGNNQPVVFSVERIYSSSRTKTYDEQHARIISYGVMERIARFRLPYAVDYAYGKYWFADSSSYNDALRGVVPVAGVISAGGGTFFLRPVNIEVPTMVNNLPVCYGHMPLQFSGNQLVSAKFNLSMMPTTGEIFTGVCFSHSLSGPVSSNYAPTILVGVGKPGGVPKLYISVGHPAYTVAQFNITLQGDAGTLTIDGRSLDVMVGTTVVANLNVVSNRKIISLPKVNGIFASAPLLKCRYLIPKDRNNFVVPLSFTDYRFPTSGMAYINNVELVRYQDYNDSLGTLRIVERGVGGTPIVDHPPNSIITLDWIGAVNNVVCSEPSCAQWVEMVVRRIVAAAGVPSRFYDLCFAEATNLPNSSKNRNVAVYAGKIETTVSVFGLNFEVFFVTNPVPVTINLAKSTSSAGYQLVVNERTAVLKDNYGRSIYSAILAHPVNGPGWFRAATSDSFISLFFNNRLICTIPFVSDLASSGIADRLFGRMDISTSNGALMINFRVPELHSTTRGFSWGMGESARDALNRLLEGRRVVYYERGGALEFSLIKPGTPQLSYTGDEFFSYSHGSDDFRSATALVVYGSLKWDVVMSSDRDIIWDMINAPLADSLAQCKDYGNRELEAIRLAKNQRQFTGRFDPSLELMDTITLPSMGDLPSGRFRVVGISLEMQEAEPVMTVTALPDVSDYVYGVYGSAVLGEAVMG